MEVYKMKPIKIGKKIRGDAGVSEIIGTVLLLAIAVIIFSSLIVYVLSMDTSPSAPSVHMVGSTDENAHVVIENRGGDSIPIEDLKLMIQKGNVQSHTFEGQSLAEMFHDTNGNGIWDVGDYVKINCTGIFGPLEYWQVSAALIDRPSNSIIMSGVLQNGITRPDVIFHNETGTDGIDGAANFTWSEPAVVNTSTSFTDTSQNKSYISSWDWDFDDGGSSTSQNPTHQFTASGSYDVTLNVTYPSYLVADGVRTWDTRTQTVKVYRLPVAGFVYSPDVPQPGETVSLYAANHSTGAMVGGSGGNNIESYHWDFDGDGTYDHTGTTGMPTHAWGTAGIYTIRLKITAEMDGFTFNDTTSKTIRINAPPVANFSFSPSTPITSTNVQFTDNSTDSDGSIVSWNWDFGDGNTSTAQDPTHRYTTQGDYTVTLEVTDNDGGTDTTSQQITIYPTVVDFPYVDLNNNLQYDPGDINVRDYIEDDGEFYSWRSEGNYTGRDNSSLVVPPEAGNMSLGYPLDLRANNSIVIDTNITAEDAINLEATDVHFSRTNVVTVQSGEKGGDSGNFYVDASGSIYGNGSTLRCYEVGNDATDLDFKANESIYLRDATIQLHETGNSPVNVDIESYHGKLDLTNATVDVLKSSGLPENTMRLASYDDLEASEFTINTSTTTGSTTFEDVALQSSVGDINISYATFDVVEATFSVSADQGAVIALYTAINAKSENNPMLHAHTYIDFSNATITNGENDFTIRCDDSGNLIGSGSTIHQNAANKLVNFFIGVSGNGNGDITITDAYIDNEGGDLTIKTDIGDIDISRMEITESDGSITITSEHGNIYAEEAAISTSLNSDTHLSIYSNLSVDLTNAQLITNMYLRIDLEDKLCLNNTEIRVSQDMVDFYCYNDNGVIWAYSTWLSNTDNNPKGLIAQAHNFQPGNIYENNLQPSSPQQADITAS